LEPLLLAVIVLEAINCSESAKAKTLQPLRRKLQLSR
jgi:hypothetical protein